MLLKSGDYPIAAVTTYGKGRVVAFAYIEDGFIPSGVDPLGSAEEEGFSAAGDPSAYGIYWNYWEYYYSLCRQGGRLGGGTRRRRRAQSGSPPGPTAAAPFE